MSKRKLGLKLEQRKAIGGLLFISPFLVGFFFFFFVPICQSIIYSFSEFSFGREGMVTTFVGLDNYRYVLQEHPTFVRDLTETIINMVRDVPLILLYSFFAAELLNQKIPGRTLARVIFFLPVIMGAGVILRMERTDYILDVVSVDASQGMGMGAVLLPFLTELKLPMGFIEYLLFAIDRIPMIIRASGIQILIFLAGLQSIPRSLYEASDVEGASAWENFWLITFPLMVPLIVTSVVYSIIDSFTAADNYVIDLIRSTIFSSRGYGASSAMAWIYFSIVIVILAVTMGIISKKAKSLE